MPLTRDDFNLKENSNFFTLFRQMTHQVATKGFEHRQTQIRISQIWSTLSENLDLLSTASIEELIEADLIDDRAVDFWERAFADDPNILMKLVLNARDKSTEDLDPALIDDLHHHIDRCPKIDEIQRDKRCYRLFFELESAKGQALQRGEEKEPGSLSALANSFAYGTSKANIEQELSLKMLLEMHKRAATDVTGLKEEMIPGELRDENTGFGITLEQSQGLYEILTSELYGNAYQLQGSRVEALWKGSRLKEAMKALIEEYNHDMREEKTPHEKLERIIDLIQDVIRIHPFGDANGRTIGKVLLNRELLRHGLPPTQLKENNFGTGDKCSIMSMLINGMGRFLMDATPTERALFEREILNDMQYKIEEVKSEMRSIPYAVSASASADYDARDERALPSFSGLMSMHQLTDKEDDAVEQLEEIVSERLTGYLHE